jgi:DNA-binding CsgD family transcriptional regulator
MGALTARISAVEFTRRERQVLVLISQGLTYDQIAVRLGISRRTVNAYAAWLRQQTGAENNAHLVAIAWEIGIFPFSDQAGRVY